MFSSEAAELGRGGIKTVAQATGVHPDTVARGVRELAGDPQPQVRAAPPWCADRDAQFGYLAGQVAEHAEAGQPVVSVDAKK